MTEENKASGRPGSAGVSGEMNPDAQETATIPDYVMLDFADEFLPDEAANSGVCKLRALPELFG